MAFSFYMIGGGKLLDIGNIATWAGWITTIVTLVLFVIRPIMSSFTKITKSLSEITYTLQTINKDIEDSRGDRANIHEELKDHDKRLDGQGEIIARHDEQIKTLYKRYDK